MSKPKQTVEIIRVAQGGDGVGYLEDGRVVFVPRTVPGDTVEIELTSDRKKWAKGTLLNILEASPKRIEPECPYFGSCGGCDFWHISYEDEFELKSTNAIDALRRISKTTIPDPRLVPAVSHEGYRVRSRLQLRGESVGFFRPGSHDLVPIQSCRVLVPALNERLSQEFNDGKSVLIETNGRGGTETTYGRGSKTKILAQIPTLGESEIPASMFRQANEEMNEHLVQIAVDMLQTSGTDTLLELFAGYGNFTFSAAAKFKEVIAVEKSRYAVKVGKSLAEGTNIEFRPGDLEEGYGELANATHVLLDPPRDGAREVMTEIAESESCQQVVYVSCDPGSLGRDVGILAEAGWTVTEVVLVDMFPRTSHIETIVRLIRT